MKKQLSIISIGILFLIFTSCVTTGNPNANTFSSSGKSTIGNMVISVDDFEGTTTSTHKDIGIDFESGTFGLYLEPVFKYDENNISFLLCTKLMNFGEAYKFSKIIMIGDTGKMTINYYSKQNIESSYSGSVMLGNKNETTVYETLTQKEYLLISRFFEENPKIRLALYTQDNSAKEFKEYSTRAHKIFADAYSFYQENLSEKNDIGIATGLIIQ